MREVLKMAFFDDISKKITDVSQTTIQKGKGMAETAKYNSLISDEEKKIAAIYGQIGKLYAEIHGAAPEESFAEYINLLEDSKNKVEEYQNKITELRGVTKCPLCGADVANGTLFCVSCGTPVATPATPVTPVAAPVTPVAAPVNNVAVEASFCAECGAAIPVGCRFCTSCGTPVALEEAPVVQQSAPAEATSTDGSDWYRLGN